MLAQRLPKQAIPYEVTVFIDGPDGFSRREILSLGERFVLGRSDECDLILDDCHVSRTHCELQIEKDDCWITSYGVNGTRINSQLCADSEMYKITRRDRIQIGPFTVRFFLNQAPKFDDQTSPTVVVLFSEFWRKPTTQPARARSKTTLNRLKGRLVPLKGMLNASDLRVDSPSTL